MAGLPPAPAPTSTIIPAQLGFLAIYNPSLGATDETIDDQIVYYASVDSNTSTHKKRHRRRRHQQQQQGHGPTSAAAAGRPTESLSKDERNERLRQIGLAQGMVEFGKSFSGGRPVDSIDTEKSRVVLHELEPGWWILASVDLTRMPAVNGSGGIGSASSTTTAAAAASTQSSATAGAGRGRASSTPAAARVSPPGPEPHVEYSSREVKPAVLLLRDLLRAHSVFLLHHDSSLSALFVRTQRPKFVSILGRYWDLFLSSWNVLLHGNPAVKIFGGIKIAASGELGFGVGEEERGSGEREVLEGLVGRVEGLVDLVVGRYGEADAAPDNGGRESGVNDPGPWIGTGSEPNAEDGAIFLGVGALSRHSTRAITYWMDDLYTWGENAYGVMESPTATRVQLRRKKATHRRPTAHQPPPPGMPAHVPPGSGLPEPPPPVVASQAPQRNDASSDEAGSSSGPAGADKDGSEDGMGKLFSYLKLGYGTSWTLGSSGHAEQQHTTAQATDLKGSPATEPESQRNSGAGEFLIGLVGEVDRSGTPSESEDQPPNGPSPAPEPEPEPESGLNSRTRLRTIVVELESEVDERLESRISKDLGSEETELAMQKADDKSGGGRFSDTTSSVFDSQDRNKTKKLRVVVYVNRPFIFVMLFQLHTDSLAWDGLYHSLHHQFAPLHKSLLSSTSYRPGKPENVASPAVAAQIYDLIWDPKDLTVHSTIPSIPEPGQGLGLGGGEGVWNRIEALNTHGQILGMFVSTRDDDLGYERTCKTSRGWWVVWNRILEERNEQAEVRNGGSNRSISGGDEAGMLGGIEEEDEDFASSDIGDGSGGRCQSDDEFGDEIHGGLRSMARRSARKDMVVSKEIFLIRKASDHVSGSASGGIMGSGMLRGVSASYGSGLGGSGGAAGIGNGGGWADGASRLAQGIGVDTRRYIEGLLTLNR